MPNDPLQNDHPQPATDDSTKPFLIELRQLDTTRSGSFRPVASLILTSHLRTSGLLAALLPEDLRCLLFLLSFLSPNGDCRATLHQLADAMRVPVFKAQQGMRHLAAFRWKGQPLVVETRSESGLFFYSVTPYIVAYRQTTEPKQAEPAPLKVSSREDVIARSRQMYGRPRAQVEREIEHMLTSGRTVRLPVPQPPSLATKNPSTQSAPSPVAEAPAASDPVAPTVPLSPEEQLLLRKLENAGLTTEQALGLMDKYDRVRTSGSCNGCPIEGRRTRQAFCWPPSPTTTRRRLLFAYLRNPMMRRRKRKTALTHEIDAAEIRQGASFGQHHAVSERPVRADATPQG